MFNHRKNKYCKIGVGILILLAVLTTSFYINFYIKAKEIKPSATKSDGRGLELFSISQGINACLGVDLGNSKNNICGGTAHQGVKTGSPYLSYLIPYSSYYTLNENRGSPRYQQWGRKDLIEIIYYVAKEWSRRHPNEKFSVGDLDYPPGHQTHECGIDVDIFSTHSLLLQRPNGSKNPQYSRALTIELAELFFSTNAVTEILYNNANDGSVRNEVNKYIAANNLYGKMVPYPNHNNHFHLRIIPNRFNCSSKTIVPIIPPTTGSTLPSSGSVTTTKPNSKTTVTKCFLDPKCASSKTIQFCNLICE
jgi:murein endopeptidase